MMTYYNNIYDTEWNCSDFFNLEILSLIFYYPVSTYIFCISQMGNLKLYFYLNS